MHQSYFIRGNTIDGGDVQPHNMEISDKSITIGWIREKATENEFQLTGHAHKERQEEVIKTKEIRDALMQGELLENYPDEIYLNPFHFLSRDPRTFSGIKQFSL